MAWCERLRPGGDRCQPVARSFVSSDVGGSAAVPLSGVERVGLSREDFETLAARARPRVWRMLRTLGADADAADELTQECLLRAYRARESFRGASSGETWLITIAINLAWPEREKRKPLPTSRRASTAPARWRPCGVPWGRGAGGSTARRGPACGPAGPGRPGGPLGGPEAGNWWQNSEVVAALGLDEAQTKKIEQVFLEERLKLIDLRADLERGEVRLQPLIEADTPDEVKVGAQIDACSPRAGASRRRTR
jgi:sigma-70-like protein/heavy-metal resistance protein